MFVFDIFVKIYAFHNITVERITHLCDFVNDICEKNNVYLIIHVI